jgi:hypothetical protein
MSTHKQANGRYRARWRDGGKRWSKTFRTMREAQAYDREMHKQLRVERDAESLGLIAPRPKSMTVSESLEQYMERRNRQWSDGTFELFGYCVDRILEHEWFARLNLDQLSVRKVDELREAMFTHQERQYAERRGGSMEEARKAKPGREIVVRALGHLQAAIRLVRADNPSVPDPFLANERRTAPSKESEIFPYEAVELLARAIEGKGFVSKVDSETLVRFAADGVRPGAEPLALIWADVHEKTLSITKHLSEDEIANFPMHSSRRREMTMSVSLRDCLAKVYELRGRPSPSEFIFPGPDGQAHWKGTDYRNWRCRCWLPAHARVVAMSGEDEWMEGLLDEHERKLLAADQRPYVLRHCRASVLLAANVPLSQIEYELATSLKMVDDTYGRAVRRYAVSPTGVTDPDDLIRVARARVDEAWERRDSHGR